MVLILLMGTLDIYVVALSISGQVIGSLTLLGLGLASLLSTFTKPLVHLKTTCKLVQHGSGMINTCRLGRVWRSLGLVFIWSAQHVSGIGGSQPQN